MAHCPRSVTVESFGKPADSDNVSSVEFAISETSDFASKTWRDADDCAKPTVAQPASAVQSVRVCVVCANPLSGQQQACCSITCSLQYARRFPNGRDQHGEKNANWKGGRAKRPVVYVRRFKALNPEKARAHQIVSAAIRSGLLTRPSFCASCGRTCRPDAHHPDYSLPLSVEWLCRKCHVAADRVRARQESLKAGAATAQKPDRNPNVSRYQFKFRGTHARTVVSGIDSRKSYSVSGKSVAR